MPEDFLPIGKFIKNVRLINNLTQEQLAEMTGVSQSTINSYENGRMEPKTSFRKKFKEKLGHDLDNPNITNVVSRETISPSEVAESVQKYGTDPLHVIGTMAESNRALSESNRTLADSNKSLAKGTEELIQLTKAAIAGATAGTPPIVQPTLTDLLVLIAELGTGTHWKTNEEGLAILSRRFYGPQKAKTKKGIHQHSDK